MNEHARVARLLQHRLFGPPNRFSTLSQSTSTHSVRRKRMRHDPAFRSSAFLLMIAVAVFPRNGSLTLKAQDLAPSIYFTFRPLRCDDHARQMEGFPNYQREIPWVWSQALSAKKPSGKVNSMRFSRDDLCASKTHIFVYAQT